MTVREYGASNGRVQGFPVEKMAGSRKKKRFRKNKISPAEKIAWEECNEENAKKSHALLMFTSVRDLQRLQTLRAISQLMSPHHDKHDGSRRE